LSIDLLFGNLLMCYCDCTENRGLGSGRAPIAQPISSVNVLYIHFQPILVKAVTS